MGTAAQPPEAKVICSVIYRQGEARRRDEALRALERELGAIDHQSDELPFDQTRYYEEEMGTSLRRVVVSFERLVDPAELAAIKLCSNEIEQRMSEDGARTVNLDPGMLSRDNFVLATTKRNTHRVYLRDGIYADLTLLFAHGKFVPLPWTYPDYATESLHEVLIPMRERLLEQLRVNR